MLATWAAPSQKSSSKRETFSAWHVSACSLSDLFSPILFGPTLLYDLLCSQVSCSGPPSASLLRRFLGLTSFPLLDQLRVVSFWEGKKGLHWVGINAPRKSQELTAVLKLL